MSEGMKSVCVFCGSSSGARPEYADAARAVGATLARQGLTTIYGGAGVGLMGIVADGALAGGGRVIGVLPERLQARELRHKDLSELHIVPSMHARKQMMSDLADGFIALPGGFGTLEEVFEIATWAQLGLHRKPVGFLNVAGYYDSLFTFLDHAVGEQLLRRENRQMLLQDVTPEALLDRMRSFVPQQLEKWLDRASQT